jgi:hypothetical protein
MKIRRISDGVIFEVRKYVNGFGEESVWCDDWYGHHMIGRDCEFVNAYTAEDMNDFAEWSYKQSYRKMWNAGKYIGYSGMLELWEQQRKEATEL